MGRGGVLAWSFSSTGLQPAASHFRLSVNISPSLALRITIFSSVDYIMLAIGFVVPFFVNVLNMRDAAYNIIDLA